MGLRKRHHKRTHQTHTFTQTTSIHKTNPSTKPISNHYSDISIALTTIVVSSILYVTAYTSLTGGDSGELLVVSCLNSVAHPPGYPIFTMLSHLLISVFHWISPAYVINLSSVVFGGIAAAITHMTLLNFEENPSIPFLIASSSFSISSHLSPTLWLYYLQAEVFALHHFFLTLMIYLTSWYFRTKNLKFVYIGAFICGLAASNQHTSILLSIPIGIITLWDQFHYWISFKFYRPILLALCFLMGLIPYIHLPLASFHLAPEAWGDHRSLEGFFTHFFRKEYGTFSLASKGTSEILPSLQEKLSIYIFNFFEESVYILAGLSVLSLVLSIRITKNHQRAYLLTLLLSFLLYTAVFQSLSNLDFRPLFFGVQQRFWPHANILLFSIGGFSIVSLRSIFSKFLPFIDWGLAILLVSTAAAQISLNFNNLDHSNDLLVSEYGKRLLIAFPENSLVFANGDLNNNALMYFKHCEHVQPGVDLIGVQQMSRPWWIGTQRENFPRVNFPAGKTIYHPHRENGFSLAALIDLNYEKRQGNVFICGGYKDGDTSATFQYELLPFGPCKRIIRRGTRDHYPINKLIDENLNALIPSRYSLRTYDPMSWEQVVLVDAFWGYYDLFIEISRRMQQKKVNNVLLRTRDISKSLFALRKFASKEDPKIWKNIGVLSGLASAVPNLSRKEQIEAESQMIDAWAYYLSFEPMDKTIVPLFRDRFNPYLQRFVE